ncbi:hypothetical protein LCGC14_2550850, partial [marine sediment metagenome]
KLLGNYSLLNPVVGEKGTYYPMATGSIRSAAAKEPDLTGFADSRWKPGEVVTDAEGTQSVTFTTTINRSNKPYVRLEKTYVVRKFPPPAPEPEPRDDAAPPKPADRPDAHSFQVRLRAVNLTGREMEIVLTQFAAAGVPREDIQNDRRTLAYGKLVKGTMDVLKVSAGKIQKIAPGLPGTQVGRSSGIDPVTWIGVTNKFFGVLTYIVPGPGSQTQAAPSAKASFFNAVVEETSSSRTFLPVITLGPYRIAPGQAKQINLDVFAGPKKRSVFDSGLYESLKYKDSLDFGGCPCAFAPLSLAMMWLLEFFSKVMLGNYGLAIVLLVVLVRLCLHPLTKRGQVAMMSMQKLQPEMARIKEKHKNDKAKLNEEITALYKKGGFKPMLGCLPMVLQMPIWIALWTGLQASVELRHAAFLPVWITDLAAPDALIDFGKVLFVFPMVGPISSFNLLPLLLAVAMFLQQKYSPQAAAPTATPEKQST